MTAEHEGVDIWTAARRWFAAKHGTDPDSPSTYNPGTAAPFTGTEHPYVGAALDGACSDIAAMTDHDGRNNAVNAQLFRFCGFAAAGHLQESRAVAAIRDAAMASGLAGLELRRLLRTDATGAIAAGRTHPQDPPPRREPATLAVAPTPEDFPTWAPDGVDPATGEVQDQDIAAQVKQALPRLDWHALWADESQEEWLLEPLLPARRLVALYSPPKVGKSLLMLELAAGLAAGRTVLSESNVKPRRVLYVDMENDPRGDVRERLQAMGYEPDDLERLDYLSYPQLAMLDTPVGGQMLLAAAQAYGSEVVIIDTISRVVGGEENANDTWLAFYRCTGSKLKAAGIACVRLDHSGKDAEKGMRGGSAKYGDVDAVWRLSTVSEGRTYLLECTDHRFPLVETELTIHREQVPWLHHRVDPGGSYAAYVVRRDETVQALDQAGVAPSAGFPTCRDALKAAGHKAGTATIRAAVKVRQARWDPDAEAT